MTHFAYKEDPYLASAYEVGPQGCYKCPRCSCIHHLVPDQSVMCRGCGCDLLLIEFGDPMVWVGFHTAVPDGEEDTGADDDTWDEIWDALINPDDEAWDGPPVIFP